MPGTFGMVHLPWTAEHGEWDPPHYFTDRMAKGPLGEWEHRHVFEETEAGGTLIPVSYTHLDVYKRQPSCWSWNARSAFSCRSR